MKYRYPGLDLLIKNNAVSKFMDRDYVKAMAEDLARVLESFGVEATITDIKQTPFAVLFDILPDEGVKVKSITSLRVDIELHMTSPVEIVSIGDKSCTVGIAVKNWVRPLVSLREIMTTDAFRNSDYIIPIAAGMDVLGKPFVFDLSMTPHLLVAGATGSGKSVFINDIIMSILYKCSPDDVKLILIDPKRVELSAYNGIPHLMRSVIYDTASACTSLLWCVDEIKTRFSKFAESNVKNIDTYNLKLDQYDKDADKLPRVVVIIDEYMEMMFRAPKELEECVDYISSKGRAAGVHLVMATQRPTSNVISNNIKASIPCRASFTVIDWRESKTIIDRTGAERLLGSGDMLYSSSTTAVPVHAQAAYVSDKEIDDVIEFVKKNH